MPEDIIKGDVTANHFFSFSIETTKNRFALSPKHDPHQRSSRSCNGKLVGLEAKQRIAITASGELHLHHWCHIMWWYIAPWLSPKLSHRMIFDTVDATSWSHLICLHVCRSTRLSSFVAITIWIQKGDHGVSIHYPPPCLWKDPGACNPLLCLMHEARGENCGAGFCMGNIEALIVKD